MDAVSLRIVELVRDANERSAEICYKDLITKGLAAPPTVQKKIRELLDSGELIGTEVQTPHGIKRLLFVPERFTSAHGTVLIRQNGMMIYQLKRIADSLEQANATGPRESSGTPRKKADGRFQTKIWGRDENERED